MRDFALRMLDIPMTQKTSFSMATKNGQMSQWRKEVVMRE